MRTKGQIEDELAKEFTKFYVKKLKTGPKQAKVYIVDDMILVRLKGDLHPYEEILLSRGKHGIELVKQIREHIHETVIDETKKIIHDVTKMKVTSFHSDSSTRTGERFEIFILDRNFEKTL
ncbi:hypothetical protein COY90_02570 [Candidatus Roizmanbacteria bacterium CG_4_10_14_0_8_um_filter_39_9]|uniref:Na+-translocating membrane potential-generating system MpsC domain-containing protein n=1 Tax=Candidatus Roizmanbacteria bacterium CG_4_10_14_0_8_um_filter_39_9 TaxID=1974829 RepID=A0A2M7QDX4_9BACT|nr:MAG: hypothetical protein COY90_02570 [Candidatus Roizmanbacteria bacterium CG_4_10_14_0_8_um_filter_39_9]